MLEHTLEIRELQGRSLLYECWNVL
ncbi:YALI0F23881p [Yarrowia lipolytica CLIB122]|uniref:YALI0F23881p n=1 Tax=Yarrowia lipolytica (strain CLIB 122 / E 150) TaxID=284591 RepID=Q6C0K6_YARLI|nr:YALI0F23881p [Yarrowia lipolytica CLIB122]CAG78617.1 YALI0F23881p [Yarrowia lipolytica CLIB122]|eukprot:XP_505806.1 YALI0F23881p [Yarrowia lipolytica CLIB122]